VSGIPGVPTYKLGNTNQAQSGSQSGAVLGGGNLNQISNGLQISGRKMLTRRAAVVAAAAPGA
jgi:hypothetical protein